MTNYSSLLSSRIPSSAGSTNVTLAATGERKLHTAVGYNSVASIRFLKFYDKSVAPTVGMDVPVLTVALPPSTGFAIDFRGHVFFKGLGYALTSGFADNDASSIASGDILGLNVLYS